MIELKPLLQKIQSGSLEDIDHRVSDLVTHWMAAGCVTAANRILSAWKPVTDTDNLVAALANPWRLTQTSAPSWAHSLPTAHDLRTKAWANMFGQFWTDDVIARVMAADPSALRDRWLLIRAVYIGYDASQPYGEAERERLLESAALIDSFLASDSPDAVGYEKFRASTCRSLPAARLGDRAEVERKLLDWAQTCAEYRSNSSVSYTLLDPQLAEVLMSGLIAAAWKVAPADTTQAADSVVAALESRYATAAPTLVYGRLSWLALLGTLQTVLQNVGEAGLIQRPPASGTAITAAEARLDVALPARYRDFLRASNGLVSYNDAVGVEVYAVEQIVWLRDVMPELAGYYEETPDLAEGLSKALLIGAHQGMEQMLLLVPPAGQNSTAEWECWFAAHWLPGATKYPAFRYFIEDEIQKLAER
jgi:hypothetical protein